MKPPESMADRSMTATAGRGIRRGQMTLQELQELAERQRQQILKNNQELIAKQQKLMEMQSGVRKASIGSPGRAAGNQDAYASKLRETYQNHLERLREMKLVQDEVESQKFSNIELAYELERVREIFSAKQKELVSAAAKVDNLTKQLEDRKNGLAHVRATPERINRRRKIRAAREELDRLRSELQVRNELNNQQSVQLHMQQEIIQEKKRELHDLDNRIQSLGNQLQNHHGGRFNSNLSTSSEIINGDVNANTKFSPNNLFDTLQKKKLTDRAIGVEQRFNNDIIIPPPLDLSKLNDPRTASFNGRDASMRPGNIVGNGTSPPSSVPYFRRGNLYVAPDGREFDRPPTLEDYPEFGMGLPELSNGKPPSPALSTHSEESIASSKSFDYVSPHLPRSRTDINPMVQVNSTNAAYGSQKGGRMSGPQVGLLPANTSGGSPVNSPSPSSSLSSLSSISSAAAEESHPSALSYKESIRKQQQQFAQIQQRLLNKSSEKLRAPLGPSENNRSPTSISPPVNGAEIWGENTDFRTSSPIPTPAVSTLPKASSSIFSDSLLSSTRDIFNSMVLRYIDCVKSDGGDTLRSQVTLPSDIKENGSDYRAQPVSSYSNTNAKGKPPPISPKPAVAPKPAKTPPKAPPRTSSGTDTDISKPEGKDGRSLPKPYSEMVHDIALTLSDDPSKISVHQLVEQFKDAIPVVKQPVVKSLAKSHYPSEAEEKSKAFTTSDSIPTPNVDIVVSDLSSDATSDQNASNKKPAPEPLGDDNYRIDFADIDMISQTQNDLIPFMLTSRLNQMPGMAGLYDQSVSNYSEDDASSQASDNDKSIVPIVYSSVPPELMPPPILKWPGDQRREKRKVRLDPLALLLDAALEGELQMVREVVGSVPDPSKANAEGITALHNAVCGNHKEVVKFLVEIGCDINAPDNNGWTPLHCAAFYNDTELCRYLVEHGASVFAYTYSDRQTAAEKCSRLEDNYDQCFGYLHDCKENTGRQKDGKVFALYDYSKEEADELSFHTGEILTIKRRGDADELEWWWAENTRGEAGYVPYNLLGGLCEGCERHHRLDRKIRSCSDLNRSFYPDGALNQEPLAQFPGATTAGPVNHTSIDPVNHSVRSYEHYTILTSFTSRNVGNKELRVR